MVAVSVTFDGTILSGAESESDGGVWDIWGKGTAPQDETDFVYQGTQAMSLKVSSTTAGVEFEDDATVDYTTPKAVLAKILITTTGLIDLTVAAGASYQIGSSTANYYNYYLYGLYAGSYPKRGGWLILPIDPNEEAFIDAETTAPTLSAIMYYGLLADITGTSKSENVIHDRLDYMDVGSGLTLEGGSTGEPGVFQDFVDADEGSQTDSYGVVATGEAEIVTRGVLTIGTTTETVFDDSNFVIVFPHERVSEGFFGIDGYLENASTSITFTAGTFKSLGNVSTKKFFDTELQVSAAADTITLLDHGFSTGDYILYSSEDSTAIGGLSDNTNYFVRAIDSDTIALYAVGSSAGRQNSFTDTSRLSLAEDAVGFNHSIVRVPDTRADHTFTETSGSANWESCSIDGAREITFTSVCTMTGGFILNAGNVDLSTGSLSEVTVLDQTTQEGYALFTPLTTLDNITNCTLVSGVEGHAFELTSTGSTDSDLNTFTDWWSPAVDGYKFHTITGVDSNIITTNAAHGFTTGDAVYYNDEGGSDDVGLIDGYKYYVNVATTTTFTMHITRAAAVAASGTVTLNDGSTGETHSIYGGNAVVYNNSGGAITINVLNDGDTPSVRNGTGASTTVQNTKTLTVTCLNTSGTAIENVRVRIEAASDGSLISEGYTNASGIYQDTTYPYVIDVSVNVIARLKGFRFNQASSTIDTSGLSVPFTMIKDSAVNLP